MVQRSPSPRPNSRSTSQDKYTPFVQAADTNYAGKNLHHVSGRQPPQRFVDNSMYGPPKIQLQPPEDAMSVDARARPVPFPPTCLRCRAPCNMLMRAPQSVLVFLWKCIVILTGHSWFIGTMDRSIVQPVANAFTELGANVVGQYLKLSGNTSSALVGRGTASNTYILAIS